MGFRNALEYVIFIFCFECHALLATSYLNEFAEVQANIAQFHDRSQQRRIGNHAIFQT